MIWTVQQYRTARSAVILIAAICLVTTAYTLTANKYEAPGAVTAEAGVIVGNKGFIYGKTAPYPYPPSEAAAEAERETLADFTVGGISEIENDMAEANDENDGDFWNAATSMADFIYLPDIPLSEELQRFTYGSCIENKLDYSFVLALMWRESRFKADAVGLNSNGTADSGIMQINDVNRKWLSDELGITDLLDPRENITAGTTMLGRFVEKHGAHNALLAYQYGESGMKKKLEQGVTTNGQIQLLYAKRKDFADMLGM